MISRRNDTGHNNCVDETACDLAANLLENKGEGTGLGVSRGKIRIIVWDIESNYEDGKHVEDENTPEDIADHTREISSRVASFTGCDSDGFSSSTRYWSAIGGQEELKQHILCK